MSWLELPLQRHALGTGQARGSGVEQFVEIELVAAQPLVAEVDAAGVEHAGDRVLQDAARIAHASERAALIGAHRPVVVVDQQVDVADQRRQRRAQLVRHRGQKLGLDAFRFLRLGIEHLNSATVRASCAASASARQRPLALLARALDQVAVEDGRGEEERHPDQRRRGPRLPCAAGGGVAEQVRRADHAGWRRRSDAGSPRSPRAAAAADREGRNRR